MRIEQAETRGFLGASSNRLTCHVPCKLNLFLEVLGKRSDGYHDLETVMLAVDLCDTLSVGPSSDTRISLRIECSSDRLSENDPAWDVPADEKNLVVRALRRLQSELGVQSGLDVELIKRIPAQAGLGGGSADAAAALVLGGLVWTGRLNHPWITRIAAELGSDLNFFLEGWSAGGWAARCTGRGETVMPFTNPRDQHFVIIHPPQGCNTAEIFRNLTDQSLQPPQSSGSLPRNSDEMLQALALGQNERLGALLYNRLDLVARQCNPWIDRTAKWFDRYKPLGQCLSGSGSARFCLCSDHQEAEKIGRELALWTESRVFVASTWRTPSIQEQIKQLGFGE